MSAAGSWPTPQDYNLAIQNPQLTLADPELRSGSVATNKLGLPVAITGAFASVYKVQTGAGSWAVRCFDSPRPDTRERYDAISAALRKARLPYTVGFEYLQEGIRVDGAWYPILKMEWVQGVQLDRYVRDHLGNTAALLRLAERWSEMVGALESAGIAHGDLQHGNVLVVGDRPILVDYDGMFVHKLRGRSSHELGHRNYQHPKRGERDFGPSLDRFSAWVIYLSLAAVAHDPSLWGAVDAGDDCLLFRRTDFDDPAGSKAFGLLESHAHPDIGAAARQLRWMLALAPLQALPLSGCEVWGGPVEVTAPPSRRAAAGAGQPGGLGARSWLPTAAPDPPAPSVPWYRDPAWGVSRLSLVGTGHCACPPCPSPSNLSPLAAMNGAGSMHKSASTLWKLPVLLVVPALPALSFPLRLPGPFSWRRAPAPPAPFGPPPPRARLQLGASLACLLPIIAATTPLLGIIPWFLALVAVLAAFIGNAAFLVVCYCRDPAVRRHAALRRERRSQREVVAASRRKRDDLARKERALTAQLEARGNRLLERRRRIQLAERGERGAWENEVERRLAEIDTRLDELAALEAASGSLPAGHATRRRRLQDLRAAVERQGSLRSREIGDRYLAKYRSLDEKLTDHNRSATARLQDLAGPLAGAQADLGVQEQRLAALDQDLQRYQGATLYRYTRWIYL